MQKQNNKKILIINQTGAGIAFMYTSIGGNQPPKNNIEPIAHINNIFDTSAKKSIHHA